MSSPKANKGGTPAGSFVNENGDLVMAKEDLAPGPDLLGKEMVGVQVPGKILYYLFEDADYFESWGPKGRPFVLAARLIANVMNVFIVISTVAFCFETKQEYSADPHRNPVEWEFFEAQWAYVEVTCVLLFTVDLGVRAGGSVAASGGEFGPAEDGTPSTAAAFINDPMNWIDCFAIAPFYMRLVVEEIPDLRFLRVIRLARILRGLKTAKYGSLGGVVVDIVKSSVGALFIPIYFMCLALIIFSSIMFYIEKTREQRCTMGDGTIYQPYDSSNTSLGNEGCATKYGCTCAGELSYITYDHQIWSDEMYGSIPDAFWWCIVTFTTVGYGDKYPRTGMGRILCSATMFAGIFFLAMPLTIVGSSFSDAWDKLQGKRLKAESHERQAGIDDEEPVWFPNYKKVAKLREDIKAHLHRSLHLIEELRDDSQRDNAGDEIVGAWDKNVEKLKHARDHFDVVVGLYDPDAEEMHKEILIRYADQAAAEEAAEAAAKKAEKEQKIADAKAAKAAKEAKEVMTEETNEANEDGESE